MARRKQKRFIRNDGTTAAHVWIELETPDDKAEAANIEKSINAILKPYGHHFRWSEHRSEWHFVENASGTYTSLRDNGQWLNLEYLARVLTRD